MFLYKLICILKLVSRLHFPYFNNCFISGFEKKQYTTAVFLDITQAFDRVLEQKLNSSALPKYLLKTIISFLSNPTFQIRNQLLPTSHYTNWSLPRLSLRPNPFQNILSRHTNSSKLPSGDICGRYNNNYPK